MVVQPELHRWGVDLDPIACEQMIRLAACAFELLSSRSSLASGSQVLFVVLHIAPDKQARWGRQTKQFCTTSTALSSFSILLSVIHTSTFLVFGSIDGLFEEQCTTL